MKIFGKLKDNQGQALVETALVLPFIIIILMGIIDFGMMFNNYLLIGNASREAARSAAIGSTDTEIRSIVSDVTGTLDQSSITVTISPSESLRKKGDEVSVTVKYNYKMITPVIEAVVSDAVQLTSRSVMRVE